MYYDTIVAWQVKMYHSTSLAKLERINSCKAKRQIGFSITSSSRLLNIWGRQYLNERIDKSNLKHVLEVRGEEWE